MPSKKAASTQRCRRTGSYPSSISAMTISRPWARTDRVMAVDYSGKVAVVTGGAGGIGRGLVHALLSRGARVVVADVEGPALATAVDELGALGRVRGRQTDVADPDSVEAP